MTEIKNKNLKWWLGIASCVVLFSFIGFFDRDAAVDAFGDFFKRDYPPF